MLRSPRRTSATLVNAQKGRVGQLLPPDRLKSGGCASSPLCAHEADGAVGSTVQAGRRASSAPLVSVTMDCLRLTGFEAALEALRLAARSSRRLVMLPAAESERATGTSAGNSATVDGGSEKSAESRPAMDVVMDSSR